MEADEVLVCAGYEAGVTVYSSGGAIVMAAMLLIAIPLQEP
jgi:hypothetical protein